MNKSEHKLPQLKTAKYASFKLLISQEH